MPGLVSQAECGGPRFAHQVSGIALSEHRRRCLAKLRTGDHLVRRMSDAENGSTALTTSYGSDLFNAFGPFVPEHPSQAAPSPAAHPPFVANGRALTATIFPQGIERIKCFVIDGRFEFSRRGRETRQGAYVNTMFIALTEKLNGYFSRYLYPDQGPAGMRLDDRFRENPRFKIENYIPEEENYTIAIPAAGWSTFWSNVDSFDIEPVPDISGRGLNP